MTAPKSTQERAEEFAFNYSESYATVARSAYLAGHAAGVEDARELVEYLELALSFAPKGQVPKDLAPMFYHTLNYQDECKLQERIDRARETLARLRQAVEVCK